MIRRCSAEAAISVVSRRACVSGFTALTTRPGGRAASGSLSSAGSWTPISLALAMMALVTAAAGAGIGQATARRLAAGGALLWKLSKNR